jgi:hypothetical protein
LAQSKDKAEAIVKEMLIAMAEQYYNNTHFIQWDFVNRKPHGINGMGSQRTNSKSSNFSKYQYFKR